MKECCESRQRCAEDTSPTLSFHGGKPGGTAHNLLEEVSSQTGASPRAPFRFTQSSRSPSIWSLSPEGRWAHLMIPDNLMHYCVHIRVTLGEGSGDQPPPSHAWSGLLIADMFQDGLQEWITKAVVLAAGEAILFFERWLHKEGLPYTSARDVGFSLTGLINWAGRTAQVEATTNTVQEGHQAIVDTVMEKKTRALACGAPDCWGELSGPQLAPVL